jgi:hypothetical protein
MPKEPKWIAFRCVVILLALYVVGVVRHGVLRNVVQTLPLWIPIVLGFRGNEFAKWSALPCLVIWLAAMMIVWLFLFRWMYVQSWHFSPTEIAMTLIVGVAAQRDLAQLCAGAQQYPRSRQEPLLCYSARSNFWPFRQVWLQPSPINDYDQS